MAERMNIDELAAEAIAKLAAWKVAQRATTDVAKLPPTRAERKAAWAEFVATAGERYANEGGGLLAVAAITSGVDSRREIVATAGDMANRSLRHDLTATLAGLCGPLLLASGETMINRMPEGTSARDREKRLEAAKDSEAAAERELRELLDVDNAARVLGELERRRESSTGLESKALATRGEVQRLEAVLEHYRMQPNHTAAGLADVEHALGKARREQDRIVAALADSRAAVNQLRPLQELAKEIIREADDATRKTLPTHDQRSLIPERVEVNKSAFLRTPREALRAAEMNDVAEQVWSR